MSCHSSKSMIASQAHPDPADAPGDTGLRAELVSALGIGSLMLVCSAEHLLDHLDRR